MSARLRSLGLVAKAQARIGRSHPSRRSRRPEADGLPVAPDRPSSLDGGAAAALTFDD